MGKYITILPFYMPDGRKYENGEIVTFVNDSLKDYLLYEGYINENGIQNIVLDRLGNELNYGDLVYVSDLHISQAINSNNKRYFMGAYQDGYVCGYLGDFDKQLKDFSTYKHIFKIK